MRPVRILPALAPLALLCGCGGSGGETEPGADGATASTLKPMMDSAPEEAPALAAPPAAFAQCRSCHSVEPGKNGIGPSLAGIVGSKAGDVPGYNFSDPLKASGIVWTRQNLDQWLQGPMKMVPGTKMVIGLPNPEARQSVIDYLETLK